MGINRLLARLRHVFSWAIERGHVRETPFKVGGQNVVKLKKEICRDRRLQPGEEAALLKHAGRHLHDVIVALLDTRCRIGELLALQWFDVLYTRGRRVSSWRIGCDQDGRNRIIPVSSKLSAILEMRRTALDGRELKPDTYVFGNEVGERIKKVNTACCATCRRAGIVGLHVHDLRREFGSRLLESGAPLHTVRDFLGHADISQTSTYLAVSDEAMARALRQMERAQQNCHTAADCDNHAAPHSETNERPEIIEQ